jgi:hypothetical protein
MRQPKLRSSSGRAETRITETARGRRARSPRRDAELSQHTVAPAISKALGQARPVSSTCRRVHSCVCSIGLYRRQHDSCVEADRHSQQPAQLKQADEITRQAYLTCASCCYWRIAWCSARSEQKKTNCAQGLLPYPTQTYLPNPAPALSHAVWRL